MSYPNVPPANSNPMPTAPAAPVQETPVPDTQQQAPVQETAEHVHVPAQAPVQEPAQPVQEPVAAPEPEPVKEAPKYEPTGNEFFDSAAAVAADAGLSPADVAKYVTEHGNLSDEHRKALVSKIGEAHTNLLLQGFKSEVKKSNDSVKSVLESVHKAVGGEDTWKQIQEWTRSDSSGLTEEGEKEYNRMLQAGGIQAELAAKALKEAYMASPGFKESNPNMTPADAAATPSPSVAPISRPQYVSEYKKAQQTGNLTEIKILDERARVTMERYPDQWRPARITG